VATLVCFTFRALRPRVEGHSLLGATESFRLENLARLKQIIDGFGAVGPLLYVAGYVLAVVFFVPGLPITLLGNRPERSLAVHSNLTRGDPMPW
jgi:hypothetical protein